MGTRILLAALFTCSLLVTSVHAAENIIGKIPLAGSLMKEFKQNDYIKPDDKIVAEAWARNAKAPDYEFKYGMDELEAAWPELMRGLRLPYPSVEYLTGFYERYPEFYKDVADQNASMEDLSKQTLEVWLLFFSGDYKAAYDLGMELGGYAREPALVAQVVYGVYLTQSSTEKQHMLQAVANETARIAHMMEFKEKAEKYPEDFLQLQLAYAYAMGRAIEDASVPRLLRSSAAFKVMDTVNAMLDTDPDHTLALALNSAVDSNTIRKMGKIGGKMMAMTNSKTSKGNYEKALKAVGDMAILRLEYANTILFIDKDEGLEQAILNLWIASNTKAHFAMEELDRLYSAKRLQEIKTMKEAGVPFKKFDKARAKFIRKQDINMYWLEQPAFEYKK